MATVTVPGLKDSTGMKPFVNLDSGRYKFRCTGYSVKPSDKSPADVHAFTFEVVEGPEQRDGKSSVGKRHMEWVTIMRKEHPNYRPDQFGVDTIKSMCLAFGIAPRGDDLNFETFVGLEADAQLYQQPAPAATEDNPDPKVRVKISAWFAASGKAKAKAPAASAKKAK